MNLSQNDIQLDTVPNPRVTWESCSVLLDINDGNRLVFDRLTPCSTLKIGNKNYSLRPLIGCPFGSLFQADNGKEGPFLSRIILSNEVPLTMGFSKAIFFYWITSNVFSRGYGLALKVPAVKKSLGIPEMPVDPPPASGGSQPSFSLSSMLKQLNEATQNSSRASSPVEAATKVSDQRISSNAVMSRRIKSLEKQVKGRKRSSKKR